eukprot:13183928-Alexandrium_andersonii.AAC.1
MAVRLHPAVLCEQAHVCSLFVGCMAASELRWQPLCVAQATLLFHHTCQRCHSRCHGHGGASFREGPGKVGQGTRAKTGAYGTQEPAAVLWLSVRAQGSQ